MDKKTDRPYFIGPFQPRPGVQKKPLSLLKSGYIQILLTMIVSNEL